DFNAKFFEAEIFHIAGDADRRNDAIDGERLRAALAAVDGGRDAVRFLVEPCHRGAGEDFDALLLEGLAGEARDFAVLDGEDLRQHLNDRAFRPERAIERGELDADGAGADHQQRLWHALGDHRLEISPHQPLVRLEARQHSRPGPGGDNDVLCLIYARPERALWGFGIGRLDSDLAGRIDRGLAPNYRHLVLLHQNTDAVVQAFRHAARTFHHGSRIVGHLLGRESVARGLLHVVEDLRRAQQRLGRDAAPIETDAAEVGALHDCGLEAELRRPDRRYVPAGAGADDDDV